MSRLEIAFLKILQNMLFLFVILVSCVQVHKVPVGFVIIGQNETGEDLPYDSENGRGEGDGRQADSQVHDGLTHDVHVTEDNDGIEPENGGRDKENDGHARSPRVNLVVGGSVNGVNGVIHPRGSADVVSHFDVFFQIISEYDKGNNSEDEKPKGETVGHSEELVVIVKGDLIEETVEPVNGLVCPSVVGQ